MDGNRFLGPAQTACAALVGIKILFRINFRPGHSLPLSAALEAQLDQCSGIQHGTANDGEIAATI